jgi:hypothetical protein
MEETSSGTSGSTDRDGTIEGVGLTIGEVQAVARRQLVGSIVAAVLVITVAGVVALRSQLVRSAVTADFSILYINSSSDARSATHLLAGPNYTTACAMGNSLALQTPASGDLRSRPQSLAARARPPPALRQF